MALTNTKTLINLLSATKSMMGDGVAWLVNADNIKNVLKSFLNIPEMARTYFLSVKNAPFPVSQVDKIPDDQLEKNLQQWEKQFGLTPASTATLAQRAAVVQAQWSVTGSLGRGYLQNLLTDSGVPVFLRENIPAAWYGSSLGAVSYGSFQYNEYREDIEDEVNYNSTNFRNFLLGNGFLSVQGGDAADPVQQPTTITQWQGVVLVEGAVFGSNVILTDEQYDTFFNIFLRYKRLDAIGLCRIYKLEDEYVLNYDFSDASRVELIGTKISKYNDKSNYGNDAIQTVVGKQYEYTLNHINGLNVATGAGAQYMDIASNLIGTGDQAFTIFVVANTINYAAQPCMFSIGPNVTSTNSFLFVIAVNGTMYCANISNDRFTANGTISNNTTTVMAFTKSAGAMSASEPKFYKNNVNQASTQGTGTLIPNITGNSSKLGATGVGGSPWNSDLCTILIAPREFSIAELQFQSLELITKWGVT